VVPFAAVRDEGTSYHYLPPAREVEASVAGVAAIEAVLKKYGHEYLLTKTWTTDGVYRETPAKIQKRRQEGCMVVEMEAAAFFAVAQFRKVVFAQLLYGGDDLSGSEWDSRHWTKATTAREKLFWLAVESCLAIG
jgi:uridine phosphorylase